MSYLNFISLAGIFGLCIIAWLLSEDRKVLPWRVLIGGIGLQLLLGFLIFRFPVTREALNQFSTLLDGVFAAADAGARFVFGRTIVPEPGQPPEVNLGYILAFRALPAVVFFSGLMALLDNLGIIRRVTAVFARVFYSTMHLSGAESLSGAANIFVGIEAAIAVKPFIAKMTRSELCAILACCFGTAASSTLAIYVSVLRPIFPNILGHLVSASIIAIPACFVLSKILVPEVEQPVTAGGIPIEPDTDKPAQQDGDPEPMETVGGEPIARLSPMDAAILGAIDGVRMAVSIAAVLILIVGFVALINQSFAGLASLKNSLILPLQFVGQFFSVFTLQNIEGVIFYPVTLLTGVAANPGQLWQCLQSLTDTSQVCVPDESWQAAVIIGRRLTETAIPPYRALAEAGARLDNPLSDRTVLIVSYALSGFAHIASVGIFVGGTIALAPSRRRDISALGWKALLVGTLATLMISCVAGFYENGDPSILGKSPGSAPSGNPELPQVSPKVPNNTPASPSPTSPSSPSPASTSPSSGNSPLSSPSPESPRTSPSPTQASPASPSPSPTPGRAGQ